MAVLLAALALVVSTSAPAVAQDQPQPLPVLQELRLQGVTVFTRDDVLWLLQLLEGAQLPRTPDAVAKALEERYERDGYTEARVTAAFDAGRLTLTADEGRIGEIEILGATPAQGDRIRQRLGVKPGDIFNARTIGQLTARLEAESQGALEIGQPRRNQPQGDRAETPPDKVVLERRGDRNVLVVPLRWRTVRTDWNITNSREDLYSPVDALAPGLAFDATIFDHDEFNHTFVAGGVS